MTFELVHFPKRQPSAREVGQAQRAFLREFGMDDVPAPEGEGLPWQYYCEARAAAHQAFVDEHVFGAIRARVTTLPE